MKNLIKIDFSDLDFEDMEKYVFQNTTKKIFVASNLLEELKLEIIIKVMALSLGELQEKFNI